MKPSKKFLQHKAAIESGEIGEGTIRGLRGALHANARRAEGWSVGRTSPNITAAETQELIALAGHIKPRIGTEQTIKGLAWLRKQYWTGAGKPRGQYGHTQRLILDNFSHFTLEDFIDVGERHAFYVPVYRAHAKNGAGFTYYNVAWQSGGTGIVLI